MIHLLITNGPQHRDFILERTLTLCEPYFDSIRIIQNGGYSNSSLIKGYTILKSVEFLAFEDCLNILKDGIPNGDWVFVLDSDERPQQGLLDELKKFGCLWEQNIISVGFQHHSITNSGDIYSLSNDPNFRPHRLFKIEEGIGVNVWGDAHFSFAQREPVVFPSSGFINHFKHDFAIWLSSACFGLANTAGISVKTTDWEYPLLKEIKTQFEKSGQFHTGEFVPLTPSSFYLYSLYYSFWKDIKPFSDELLRSTNPGCTDIAKAIDFLIQNKISLKELYNHRPCGKSCCEYKVQY